MPKPYTDIPRHKRFDSQVRAAISELGKVAASARTIAASQVGTAEERAAIGEMAEVFDRLQAEARQQRHRLWEVVC